jgi:hypothetical protein
MDRTEELQTLASALSDIGHFRWWDERFPDVVQLEFGGVQLWMPSSAPDRPPRAMLALSFIRPRSVSFLTRGDELPPDWFTQLRADQMEPPGMSFEQITLTDASHAAELLSLATRIDTVFGPAPGEVDWQAAAAMMVFWAGPAGVAIAAERMDLLTHDGPVDLARIPELHDQWWRYWRDYWDRRATADALPHDWMCEVTIPLAPE